MIWLTRFDGSRLLLNEDHLLFLESNHDTVLVMDNGERIRVHEPAEEVARRCAAWRLRTGDGGLLQLEPEEGGET